MKITDDTSLHRTMNSRKIYTSAVFRGPETHFLMFYKPLKSEFVPEFDESAIFQELTNLIKHNTSVFAFSETATGVLIQSFIDRYSLIQGGVLQRTPLWRTPENSNPVETGDFNKKKEEVI